MIDFKKKLDSIKDFMEKTYPKYLETFKLEAPFITTEFLDFDKIKAPFCLFLEFDRITFASPYADDCQGIANISCDVFLVFRNDTIANLDEKLLNASSAFHELFRCERIPIADGITVNETNFFRYVEGRNTIMASKFSMEFCVRF